MGHTHTFTGGFCGRYCVFSVPFCLCQCKVFKMRTSSCKLESPAAKEGKHTSCYPHPQQFADREEQGVSEVPALVWRVVCLLVSCRHIFPSFSPSPHQALFVHSPSSRSSQHLILVLVSILITHLLSIPCCVSFACPGLFSL